MKKTVKTSVATTESVKKLIGKYGIYFFGIILILTFAGLLLVRPRVLADTKKPAFKPQVKAAVAAVSNAALSPSPAQNSVAPSPSSPSPATSESASSSPVSPVVHSSSQDSNQPSTPDPTTQTPVVAPKATATLTVSGQGSLTVEIKDGDTAFDVLKSAAATNNFAVDYVNDPTWGAFITSIGGVGYPSSLGYNSPNGMYWSLYINGTMSANGISLSPVSDGDKIELKYEKPVW